MRTRGVDGAAFVEQVVCRLPVAEHDDVAEAEFERKDWAIFFRPLLVGYPWLYLRCLVGVADEGEAPWTWRESETFSFATYALDSRDEKNYGENNSCNDCDGHGRSERLLRRGLLVKLLQLVCKFESPMG